MTQANTILIGEILAGIASIGIFTLYWTSGKKYKKLLDNYEPEY